MASPGREDKSPNTLALRARSPSALLFRDMGYIHQLGCVFQYEGAHAVMTAMIGLDSGLQGRLVQKVGQGGNAKRPRRRTRGTSRQ